MFQEESRGENNASLLKDRFRRKRPCIYRDSVSATRPEPPVADRSVSGRNVTASCPLGAAWLERQLFNLANSPYRPTGVGRGMTRHRQQCDVKQASSTSSRQRGPGY